MTETTRSFLRFTATMAATAVLLIGVNVVSQKAVQPEAEKPKPTAKPSGPIRDGMAVINDVREIIDDFKRDGKITVDIKLPKPEVKSSEPCSPNGDCVPPPSQPTPSSLLIPPVATNPLAESSSGQLDGTGDAQNVSDCDGGCANGNCETRVFRRWRR